MPQETITYRRGQLYDEVWKEPIRVVAARYGISDVALGKICRKLTVPLPGVGYWARIAAGRKLPKKSLRPLPEGKPEELHVTRWVDGPAEIEARAIREAEEVRGERITVPAVLDQPCTLVAKTARALGAGRSRSPDGACLDISVSKNQLDRALRVMDALIKALEGRGYAVKVVEVGPPERWQGKAILTRAFVDDAWIPFSLSERLDSEEVPVEEQTREQRRHQEVWKTVPRRTVASGHLTLRMENHRYDGTRCAWGDGKRQRVEESLGAFITAMRVRASVLRRERAEAEERERAYALELARREKAEQRAREEREMEESLRDHVARWKFAKEAREYVAEVRKIVADAGVSISARGPLDESLTWIEGFAERTDPLTPVRKEATRVAALNAKKPQPE